MAEGKFDDCFCDGCDGNMPFYTLFSSAFPVDSSGHIREIKPELSYRQRIDSVILLQPGPPPRVCPFRLDLKFMEDLLEYHTNRLAGKEGPPASTVTADFHIETKDAILVFASLPLFYQLPRTPPGLEASVPSASSYNTTYEFPLPQSAKNASPTMSDFQSQEREEENTLLLTFDMKTMEFRLLRIRYPLRHIKTPEQLQDMIGSTLLEPGRFKEQGKDQEHCLSSMTLYRIPLGHVRATILGTDSSRERDAWFEHWKEETSFKTGVIFLMGQFMGDFNVGSGELDETEKAEVGQSMFLLSNWEDRLKEFRYLGQQWLAYEERMKNSPDPVQDKLEAAFLAVFGNRYAS
ncbi:MAG: hypothetical protein LQ342_004356 [Letrouitia transgressa]|nr:MAG: hypothetical protein LQ342_004356 [Letrouitia transgressa]